jgi:phage shock protein C
MNTEKKLYKSAKNKVISGVCGGLGEYFNVDPTLVRLAVVALSIFAGGGLLAYIVALIIIPDAPAGYVPSSADTTARPQTPPESADDKKESPDSSDQNTPTLL